MLAEPSTPFSQQGKTTNKYFIAYIPELDVKSSGSTCKSEEIIHLLLPGSAAADSKGIEKHPPHAG